MKFSISGLGFKQDIEAIEQELRKLHQADSALIAEITEHLLSSGGKRIRPIFVLLTAKLGEYDIEQIKYPAAALELIHSASLAHDDVIDDARTRRGVETIGAKWNNKAAIYTGDYIFAYALELMGKMKNPIAHQILADTIVQVCLGEIDQIRDKYDFTQNLRTYLRRIKRKTAILIAASCQLGAVVAGLEESIHRKLYRFGYYVGMSFQIMDDILDFTATAEALGKPAGSDLLNGNITLPVLYASADETIRALINQVHEEMTAEEIQPVLQAIKQSGAIEQAQTVSNRYLEKAYATLDSLPRNKQLKNLYEIAKYLGTRKN